MALQDKILVIGGNVIHQRTYVQWLWCWACRQLQTRKSPDLMLRTRPCLTLPVLYNLAVSFLKPTYIKLRWKPSGLLSYNKFATFFSTSNTTSIFSHVLPILVHNSYKGEGAMVWRLSFKPGFCMILFFIIQYISQSTVC